MSARRSLVLLAAVVPLVAAGPLPGGDVPGALMVLLAPPGTPGSEPPGAPPRFVLLKDGAVFVGGTSAVETARLTRGELQALRKRAEAARKAVGRSIRIGDAGSVVRLLLLEGDPLEIAIAGDPAQARPAPVGSLVAELLRYDHPSLAPYAPASYALVAREGGLAGGCRRWTFGFPIEQAAASPVTVAASEVTGWPTGAWPASVCVGERRYVVTLRPLLPGEVP